MPPSNKKWEGKDVLVLLHHNLHLYQRQHYIDFCSCYFCLLLNTLSWIHCTMTYPSAAECQMWIIKEWEVCKTYLGFQ